MTKLSKCGARAWVGFVLLFSATLLACLLASATQVAAQQPNWSMTGSLATARSLHTSTLLANGKVLIAGGRFCTSSCTELSSAELYDPATGAWSATGNLSVPRHAHIAVRLLNGKVLVAGGANGVTTWNTAELYDPNTGAWSPTGNLSAARAFATATLLANGRVLVAGGGLFSSSGAALDTAELYDPATGAWSPAGTMNAARRLHTATLLADGRVLVASGAGGTFASLILLLSAELYDTANGSWTPTGSLATARVFHTENLLPNGKALVTGGSNFTSIIYDTAELYDPATGQWSTTGNLTTARNSHTATLLANGKVLTVGGFNNQPLNKSAELYDPATGSWTATADLNVARGNHAATLLLNGKVLVSGGSNSGSSNLASAELFDNGIALPTLQFSSASYAVSEGSPRMDITINRSGDTTTSASVGFAANDGAGLTNCNFINGIASPRCDYINTLGTATWAAGDASSKSFSIAIVDDSYAEGNETFTIGLNSPSGATLGAQSTTTVTITDNDSSNGTNPIDSTNFFVRQQYLDFLGREPDPPGFAGWTATINNCAPGDTSCDRIHVSQLFFQIGRVSGARLHSSIDFIRCRSGESQTMVSSCPTWRASAASWMRISWKQQRSPSSPASWHGRHLLARTVSRPPRRATSNMSMPC